ATARHCRVDLADGLRVQPRALIVEVVACDSRDRAVAKPHFRDRLGDPARFVSVKGFRAPAVDLAERTVARAGRAADQKRRFAVLPALEDVRAASLFADRVQALAADQFFQRGVLGTHLGARLDPVRLLLDRHRGIARLDPKQLATLGRNGAHADILAGLVAESAFARWSSTNGRTSSTLTSRPSSRDSDVTSASSIPQGTIRPNQLRSGSQFNANPCIVVQRDMRTPIAAILRAAAPPLPGTHTPERPAIWIAETPKSAHTAIKASSSRRTCPTASTGMGNRTIGYPTSCPGPCHVIRPPRSTSITGVPSMGRSKSCVRRPAVKTGGCCSMRQVSGISSATRAACTLRCMSHACS